MLFGQPASEDIFPCFHKYISDGTLKKLDTGKEGVYFIHQMLEAVYGIILMDI